MSLHDTAAADLLTILEDADTGFGWPMTITDPNGTSAAVVGAYSDIGKEIDANLGVAVAGRTASVVVSLVTLAAEGLAMPENIPESTSKPWTIALTDGTGTARTYKVTNVAPDTTVGLVQLDLEDYEPL